MSSPLPVYPFDDQRVVGTIIEVGPSSAKLNLPRAAVPSGQWLHGYKLSAGEVGEYLLIESGEHAILGRLVSVKLPERERLSVEPELGKERNAHPLGTLQLLATLSISDRTVSQGILAYPRLGSRVYSAHPSLLKWVAENSLTGGGAAPLVIELGLLPSTADTMVNLTPERLFGRHCGLLGATGGGKSWTIARLIEQAGRNKAKVVLLDATGEFHTLQSGTKHIQIGVGPAQPLDCTEVAFPYHELTEGDLFALFTPSGQTQGPKLRAAMKFLKLAKLAPALAPKGFIEKALKTKQPVEAQYSVHSVAIDSSGADFDIKFLVRQIDAECVWPFAKAMGGVADHTRWGDVHEGDRNYCVTLLNRIEHMVNSKELACIFQPGGKPSIGEELQAFLADDKTQVLRLSLKYLAFGYHAREIVANAIGRHLLFQSRTGAFRQQPLVVFLDEAHQFLNKSLGDENSKYPLDSFELIAKEGRKLCLNICISTQRPRDIPEGVLSQMGTLIVHRLTNDKDREIVERASGEIDRSAAAFLPTLSPGQATIIGVDFPMPLTIQIEKPIHKPDSRGPDYQKHWAKAAKDQKSPKEPAKAKPAGKKPK